MKLYRSGERQNAKNANYPYEAEIKSIEDLAEAASYDNTCAKCKDNYRKNSNFLEADCAMFDVDNTHSENSAEWISGYSKDVPQRSFLCGIFKKPYESKERKSAKTKISCLFFR